MKHQTNWSPNFSLIHLRVCTFGLAVSLSTPVCSQMSQSTEAKPPSNLEFFIMPASSMEPTLFAGERFALDKSYFNKHIISRGDLVAVKVPNDPNVWQVKRVVGIAGDIIEIKNGILYRDGLKETNTSYSITEINIFNKSQSPPELLNNRPIRVQKYHVYVLGDNRPACLDSRIWGPLPIHSIVGKPHSIYWSKDTSRIGKILN